MRQSWRRAGLSCLVVVAACGAPPPPEVPVAPAVQVAAPPSAPDLSPIAEPRGYVGAARWKRPIRGADDVLRAFAPAPKERLLTLERLLTEEAGDVAGVLDLDASVDVAGVIDPENALEQLTAISLPLKSFDGARALAETKGQLAAVRPGVMRVTRKDGGKQVCDLAISVGDAPARLVCGNTARDVEALRDWMVRGLPLAATERGLSVTARYGPQRDLLRRTATETGDQARAFVKEWQLTDPELLAAPSVVLDEGLRFAADLDRLEVHAFFDAAAPRGIAGGSLRFAGRSSWLTQVLTDGNDRPGPAPEVFWRLPRDAEWAIWARGSDPRLFDGPRRVLHKAMADVLGRAPIPQADKAAVEAFFDGVPRVSGRWALATGVVPGKRQPAAKDAAPDEVAETRAVVEHALGWRVWGVEAPAAEYVAWARKGLALYTRMAKLARAFATPAKGGSAQDAALLDRLPKVAMVTSPPGWPRGTVAFDVSLQVDKQLAEELVRRLNGQGGLRLPGWASSTWKPLWVSMTARLAIVPDGDRTWIGLSTDLDLFKNRMLSALGGAPREGTLAARDDLADLKQPGQTWGGFISLRQLLEALEDFGTGEAGEARAALASLPHQGKTPILFLGSGAPGPTPTMAAELRLQPGTLTDLTGLLGPFLSSRGREILKALL